MLLSWIPGKDHYLGATGYSVRHIVILLLAVRFRAGMGGKAGMSPIAAVDLSGKLPILLPTKGGSVQLAVKNVAIML